MTGCNKGACMSDNQNGKWTRMALLYAVGAGLLIYNIAGATEAPSRTLMVMQYVFLAGCLIGLAGAVYKLMARA